jgi:hypothetical protein
MAPSTGGRLKGDQPRLHGHTPVRRAMKGGGVGVAWRRAELWQVNPAWHKKARGVDKWVPVDVAQFQKGMTKNGQ